MSVISVIEVFTASDDISRLSTLKYRDSNVMPAVRNSHRETTLRNTNLGTLEKSLTNAVIKGATRGLGTARACTDT